MRSVEAEPEAPARSEPFPLARAVALFAAAALTAVMVAIAPRHSPLAVALVLLSTAACAKVALSESRRPRLGVRSVCAAIAFVFAVAVVAPPRASNDIWSYAMYGRIVSVHHASPYERLPNDFASDPFLERVSPVWRHRGSVYGPAFVAFAAAGTFVAGDSPLLTRLYFQLSTAALVAAVLVIVWRRTRSPAALVWLGLHPLFGATVVNSGQVDAFVGVAVLTAALLAGKRRAVTAGVVIAVAALTKLTALLGLVGLVLWALRRRDRRSAITMTVAAAGTTALGYLPFLPAASSVLGGADHSVTPGSFWNAPAAWLVGHDAGRALPARLLPDPTLSVLFYVSLALVAVLAVGLGWRAAGRGPEPAAGVAAASYTMAAEYTLPWYAAWSLPALAERRPSPVAWVVWVQAAVLLAAWKLPLPPSGSALDTAARSVLVYLVPVVLLVAFIAAGAARPSRE